MKEKQHISSGETSRNNEAELQDDIQQAEMLRLLLVLKNISYHCEHHLFPGIPCYNLPKVHHELLKHDVVKENLYFSNSYIHVFKDCITRTQNNNR